LASRSIKSDGVNGAGRSLFRYALNGAPASGVTLALVSALDCSENVLWVRGPDEGFGIGVCLGDELVDGGLKVNEPRLPSPSSLSVRALPSYCRIG
jgi:hypothetical protein